MLNLIALPYEVISNFISYIDLEDVFNLSLSCQTLRYLLTEESICKFIVQVSHRLHHHHGECINARAADKNHIDQDTFQQ